VGTTCAVSAAGATAAATVAVIVVGVVVVGTHTHLVDMAPQYFGSPSPAGSDQQDRRRTNLWATCAYDVEICPQLRGPMERDSLVGFRWDDGDGRSLFVPLLVSRWVSKLFEVVRL